MLSDSIIIYTDGSSSGNPGPGGYGTLLTYKGKSKSLSQGFRLTTNNRMELLAVIAGLEAIQNKEFPVLIVSDSKYVCDTIQKGWLWNWMKIGFKGKKNEDLWRRFAALYPHFKITMKWIKGHAGHRENEICDQLAVAAGKSKNLLIDEGYEKSIAKSESGLL